MKRKSTLYQELRERVFKVYHDELEKSGNREIALTTALSTLKELEKEKKDLKNIKSFIEGLRTELLFYHTYHKEYSLRLTTWRVDKYLHIDFTGIHPKTGERIFIDVTKDPQEKLHKADNVKKWKEVIESLDSLGLKGKYFIATYEPDKNYLELSPLLLPVHKDGYLGFYIARLESIPIKGSLLSRLAVTIGVVYVEPKRWSRGKRKYIYYEVRDSEIIHEDLFEPYQPPSYDLLREIYKDIYFSDIDYYDESNPQKIPSFEEFVYNERYDLAYYYRKSIGVVLSAMFEYEYIMKDPRDGSGYWGHIMTWMHPVIKKKFGYKIGALLEEPRINGLDEEIVQW